MARSRNIKPSIFKNELLGVADPLLTVLFSGLWCLADREGRLEDRPLRIKAEIFPYREIAAPLFNRYITELQQLGFIERYVVGNQGIIQVVNFVKHQSPHKTEKDSELPENTMESTGCLITVNAPLSNESIHVKESLIPDSFNMIPDSLIPDSLKPEAHCRATPDRAEVVQEVFDYWQLRMDKPKALLTPKREKAIKGLVKLGYSLEQFQHAIDGCKSSAWHQGMNDRHTVYDDIELICRSGEKLESFINNIGTGAGVETLDQFRDRAMAQADRVAAIIEGGGL
jgi:hypothetical protein